MSPIFLWDLPFIFFLNLFILLMVIFLFIMSRVPIKVSNYVMGRLRGLAVSSDESYEHILGRLLDCKVGVNQFDYVIFNDCDCCVKLFVDWDVCSPVVQYYSEGVLVDEFPVDCCFDDGLWFDFKESVCGVSDLLGVLALLDCDDFTCVDGLTIVCVG